jgi:hypothetical protein
MSGGMIGGPISPITLEDHIDRLERRLSEAESRERGTGRRAWRRGVQTLIPGASELDGGEPAWRKLNDGRIELRGRVQFPGSVANGTTVLRLPGLCAPLGNGTTYRAWVSTLAPCSSVGGAPGVVRVDVQPFLQSEPYVDIDGTTRTQHVIYADVIARPSQNVPLTGWIGFDHVVYDPDLYIDALEPVPPDVYPMVFTRGVEVEPNKWAIRDLVPAEFGIAILGVDDYGPITTTPGLQAPSPPTPL